MTIDQEQLEKLLIDRELGELSPEAEALLEDCLAGDERLQALARDVQGVVAGCRKALKAEGARAKSALPGLSVRPGGGVGRVVLRTAALAAFLLLGIVVVLAVPRTGPRPSPGVSGPPVPSYPVVSRGGDSTGATRLWRIDRLAQTLGKECRYRPPVVRWEGDVLTPKVEVSQ